MANNIKIMKRVFASQKTQIWVSVIKWWRIRADIKGKGEKKEKDYFMGQGFKVVWV